jgi:hypothetical protein
MKKALINPNQTASYISSWYYNPYDKTTTPIYETYQNSQLVVDVENSEFEVAQPLYWLDCDDNVVTYRWYMDTSDNEFKEIVDALYPEAEVQQQPVTDIESI